MSAQEWNYGAPTPIRVKLTTNNATEAFEAESPLAVAVQLRFANVTSTAATITVEWEVAADATSYTLLFQHSIPGNGVYGMERMNLFMRDGDKINVTAGTANAIHVTGTAGEIARSA